MDQWRWVEQVIEVPRLAMPVRVKHLELVKRDVHDEFVGGLAAGRRSVWEEDMLSIPLPRPEPWVTLYGLNIGEHESGQELARLAWDRIENALGVI